MNLELNVNMLRNLNEVKKIYLLNCLYTGKSLIFDFENDLRSNNFPFSRAIMKLITIEDNGNMYNDDEEEDEDLSELGDDFVVVDDINFV